ncbi:MAG: RDD family protein [Gammaproteobacteria bacterium]|nr:RDD family protein [Gammaproteobacteria bacterium]
MNDASLTTTGMSGIDIEMPVAGPGARAYAFVLDIHIRALLALAWIFVAGFILAGIGYVADGVFDLISAWGSFWFVAFPGLLIYLLYHPVLEVAMKGLTPGKRFAGVRIVTESGGVPGAGPLLIRNLFRIVDSAPTFYVVGFIATLVTKRHVRIGDIAAGTVLVYFRQRKQRDIEVAEQLSRADKVTPQQAALIQELLDRWKQLQPDVRARLAARTFAAVGEPMPEVWDQDKLYARLAHLLTASDSG